MDKEDGYESNGWEEPITKRGDMDDILIISVKQSPAAKLWVDYFNSYFQNICKQASRKSFKIFHLGAEEVIATNTDVKIIEERTSGVKLQLIVVCPSLLEMIVNNPTSAVKLGKLILPDRTLALLLGVTDDDLTNVHKEALPTYTQWQRLSVGLDQDENFSKEFLSTAVSILSRVWKQQTSIAPQQKSLFSVLPKKVRQGHGSVVIILTHPLQREDIVKVSIERNNEIVEIKSVKRRNPYTLKITIPDSCTEVSAIVHILVEKNGSIIGSSPIKCESRLRELEQILRANDNPVEFMCQALGFSPADKEHMDNCLVYSFQKNLPPNFNVLFNQSSIFASSVYAHRHANEEYPTLLHFAARYGLEKLAMALLECPGGDVACDIKNSCDLTPAEIAQYAGHNDLAHLLSGYMKMNEFKNVYEKLKEMSQQNKQQINNDGEDEAGYLQPNEINGIYKTCPPPKPLNPQLLACPEHHPVNGYMAMNSTPAKITVNSRPDRQLQNLTLNLNDSPSASKDSSPSISQKSFEVYEDKVQKELVEIINDFKNNVHSISQVEKLVEEWKNRNDVQKSFKEKQQQLNEMRMKYDKIQQEMKASMKKATPFERVKKLFKGRSKDDSKVENSISVSTPATTPTSSIPFTSTQNNRPISSLSLQSTSSSGSSGRMSTISGCSMGDSGTHSDHEERKNILGQSHDDDFRNDLNKAIINLNYTVPPPPRPFHPLNKYSAKNTFPTIEERPPQPTPRPPCATDDMYYIQFPPSGLPVNGLLHESSQVGVNKGVDVTTNGDCTNAQPLRGSPQTDEFHEYMNYTPPANESVNNVNS
ncbi:phosphoinositide 3-kinase adapter protein 1 [Photinus pyralis]|uniref:phosphoinositide 3-kinase adapter protein 1 n=1 Tax=Photinus pyralis TaxID=7054 RepID=UPI001266F393|nr:phosphoinositide 3-kinase adapter protein 1 [Photinus pyralis]